MSSNPNIIQRAKNTVTWVTGTVIPTTTQYAGKFTWGIITAGLLIVAPLVYAHATDEQIEQMRQEHFADLAREK